MNKACRNAAVIAAVIAALQLSNNLKAQTKSSVALAQAPLTFSVFRQGEKIGTQKFEFKRSGDLLYVDVFAQVEVKVLFITAYRFEHEAREIWRGGQLVSMMSKTHDDGTDHAVAIELADDHLLVTADGQNRRFGLDAIPASFWNASILESSTAFNPLVGKIINFQVADKGVEEIKINGNIIKARHFSLSGDVARELWYDESWRLVQYSLIGKDGSHVQYLLE